MTTWERLDIMDGAWRVDAPGARLAAIRERARALRSVLDAMPPVRSVRSIPRALLPYPTAFAFARAARSLAPYVTLLHRTLVVQYARGERTGTLLFDPSDVERARATPFFARLMARLGPLGPLVAGQPSVLTEQLAAIGVRTEDVTELAFDHFHTQDLRALMGTEDGALRPWFPRATLLTPRVEWDSYEPVHPMQRDWMIAEGRRGVSRERVSMLEGDVVVAPGVMLVRTPGHTAGNQTLFVKTEQGIWGVSENGTSADAWAPARSRIPGLRAFAARTGLEVVMNSNTPEASERHYASMILERTMVDTDADGRPQMWPSSEVTPSALAPRIRPSFVHGELSLGRAGSGVDAQRSARTT